MKRVISTIFSFALVSIAMAGGIVTNTNQSAAFVRMPAQDAATGIHAVYHNPAGLTKLSDGFHIHIGNQTIVQTKEIESTFGLLNNKKYTGNVSAPLFPTVYAAYKTGDLAFSLGINPIGGGGGAEYKTGLPSFEAAIAAIPTQLTAQGIPTNNYDADIYFKGTSVFWGIQAGVSYKINDMISVYGGARYVIAQNTYEGHIREITINPNSPAIGANGNMVSATDFFSNTATTFEGISKSTAAAATSVQPLIDANAGGLTLTQAGVGAATKGQIEAGLLGLGVPQAQIDMMTIAQIQGAYTDASSKYATNAGTMKQYAAATADADVDTKQTGTGIAPIVGVHLTLLEDNLNIGMKYEHKTTLTITNETTKDILANPQFPDKEEIPSDMPGMLSVGASYKILPEFRAAGGVHYYFDKAAKYGKKIEGEYVDNKDFLNENSWEVAVGLEYDVSEKITLSGGWLTTNTSPTLAYQSDLSHTLKSNTVSFGALGNITENFTIDLGIMYTMYQDGEKTGIASPIGTTMNEIYRKRNTTFAIGLSYSFGGGE